jgi:hypothetical protein
VFIREGAHEGAQGPRVREDGEGEGEGEEEEETPRLGSMAAHVALQRVQANVPGFTTEFTTQLTCYM